MENRNNLMVLEDLVKNYDSYQDKLSGPLNPNFVEALSEMQELIQEAESASRYWQGQGFTATAIVEAPALIAKLRNRYVQSHDAMLSYVAKEFDEKQRELCRAESVVFETRRVELEEIVDMYKKIKGLSISESPRSVGKIEKYIEFSEAIKDMDAEFDRFMQAYQGSDLKSESEIALLKHDLQGLTQGYKGVVSRFKPRVSFNRTIFDMPQRFAELQRLSSELEYIRNNLGEALKAKKGLQKRINGLRKGLEYLSSGDVSLEGLDRISFEKIDYDLLSYYPSFRGLIDTYNGLREEVEERIGDARKGIIETKNQELLNQAKQRIQELMEGYRDIINYLSQKNDVDNEHIQRVVAFDVVDPKQVDTWKRNKYLADVAEELSDMGDMVVDKLGDEVLRIKQYLEGRVGEVEQVYGVKAKGVDEMSGLIPKLESCFDTLDDVGAMYKHLGEPTTKISELRDNVGERIEFYQNAIAEQKKEKAVEERRAMIVDREPIPKPDHYKPSAFDGFRPVKRNQGNYFDLIVHLMVIGFPPAKYMRLMNTMLDGKKHWMERLQDIGEILENVPLASCEKDLDYMYHFQYALTEDMNRGNMDHLVSRNREYFQIARQTLSELSDYISNSESALGLSSRQIEAHMAVFGHENAYNKALCA